MTLLWQIEALREKKNTACASVSLCKQHIDNHPRVTDVCFFICRRDIRAKRMWVRDPWVTKMW